MSVEIRLPQLTPDASDGLLVAWRSEVGQAVAAGQVVAEVETDKVILELESPAAGVLAVQVVAVGQYAAAKGLVAVLAEAGEDLATVRGRYAPPVTAATQADLSACPTEAQRGPILHTIPLRGTRGLVAARMVRSVRELPQYQVTVDADAEPIQDLRKSLRHDHATRAVGINAIMLKVLAEAMKLHPIINSCIIGETIYQYSQANIAVAVAMAEGVVSPVVHDVGGKSAVRVAEEIAMLVELTRSHKLRPEHVCGGTFTVSTLGSYGVRDFVALVVPPQVAIMSVGSIHSAPIVKGDQVVVGRRVSMTLSADHRAVDGAMAAEFLISLRDLLENPGPYVR